MPTILRLWFRVRKWFVSRLDYDRALQIYKERFANAADFTFVITGNFDMNEMQGLVEQYIASLPSNKNFEKAADDGKDFAKGNVRKQFTMKNEQQLAMLAMLWTGRRFGLHAGK